MKIHSYVVEHDVGFAPNPFWGVCSLANCKPRIRGYASLGDVIVGTGSTKHDKQQCLVYWMKVDEIITYDEYWHDSRFYLKKPNLYGSRIQQYGDNVYFKNSTGEVFQLDSFHSNSYGEFSEENMERDIGTTDRVLLGKEFLYFGKNAPEIPLEFSNFIKKGQNHKNKFDSNEVERFYSWLTSFPQRGFVNYPLDW